MGLKFGMPIDGKTQELIHQEIEETLKLFSTEFTKSYTQVIVNHVKQEYEPKVSLEARIQFVMLPLQTHPLKKGVLLKRGEVYKSWKYRYFILQNESLNFQIEYYAAPKKKEVNPRVSYNAEKSTSMGSLKGIIYPAGYRAYEFTDQEIIDHGDKGIKLVPINALRRTWWIQIPDDTERTAWLSMIQYACYRANPYSIKDENRSKFIQEAFDCTLQKFRFRYNCSSWYSGAGSELERLSEFLFQLIEKDILVDYLQKRSLPSLSSSTSSSKLSSSYTVENIYKSVDSTIQSTCSVTLPATIASIEKTSAQVEHSVKQLIHPILEKQRELSDLIEEKVSPNLERFLAAAGTATIRPVRLLLSPYIIQMFMKGIIGFHEYITKDIAKASPSSSFSSTHDSTERFLDSLYEAVNDWNGPLHLAYQAYDIMLQDVFPKIMALFPLAITSFLVSNIILDKFRVMLHRALYSLVQWQKNSESQVSAIISQVTGVYLRDVSFMIKSTLLTVLQTIIHPSLHELVIKSSEEVCLTSLQETLNASPIAGLPILIDLSSLIQETVLDSCESYILNEIEGGISDIESALRQTSEIIGVAYEGEQVGRSVWRISVDMD